MFRALAAWNRRRQSIRALSALSDRELSDIGIIRGEIETVVRQIPGMNGEDVAMAKPRSSVAAGAFARQALPTRA